jgi:hypothetical protein
LVFHFGLAVESKPPDVERHRVLTRCQPGFAAHGRGTAVAADRELGTQFPGAVGPLVADAGDGVAIAQQPGDFGVHPQREGWLVLAGLGEQVEEIPLRHQRDVAMGQVQAAEVDEGDLSPVDVELGLFELAVRQRVEAGKQTQIVE